MSVSLVLRSRAFRFKIEDEKMMVKMGRISPGWFLVLHASIWLGLRAILTHNNLYILSHDNLVHGFLQLEMLILSLTMVENRKKHRQNNHPIIHCPTSEGVSEVSERVSAAEGMSEKSSPKQANEWAVRANERTDKRVAQ